MRQVLGFRIILLILLPLLLPAFIQAQVQGDPPPIGQPIVREGTFAVELQIELGVGTSEDEAEAESILSNLNIMPRNGWIADYPVSPDILSEIYKSVNDSAASEKFTMSREVALKKLDKVAKDLGLGITPYKNNASHLPENQTASEYPDASELNSYYYEKGPPVVTYYAPPPDFYSLYAWVPFSFWYYGFWFPGYFILNDFHRTVFIDNRPFFVSNHFNDRRRHRVFRIDPVARYRGRTYAGIGVRRHRDFLSTGVPRSERTIFNGLHNRGLSRNTGPLAPRSGRSSIPQTRGVNPVERNFGGTMERRGGGYERGVRGR
ncbi:MAG TPA: hypothetical protein VGL27_03105 [Negativicutes bacterium]|jgi:hypothetical protein